MRYYIHLGAWKPLLLLFGATRAKSHVDVSDGTVTFRFGFFETTIPKEEIESARRARWPAFRGIGWKIGGRGTLGLVGSLKGVVEVHLRCPRPIRVLLVPFKMQRVFVSLEEPEAFLTELGVGP